MGSQAGKAAASREAGASLNRERIVAAALVLLDEVGLEGLSTRRLASDLGIKSASLYWHFRNKDELLDAMCSAMFDECLAKLAPRRGTNFDWIRWLANGARAIRRTALSRRDGAQIMARIRPVGKSSTDRIRRNIGLLQQIGFDADESFYVLQSLRRYAVGCALQEQSSLAAGQTAPEGQSEASFEFGLGLFMRGLEQRV